MNQTPKGCGTRRQKKRCENSIHGRLTLGLAQRFWQPLDPTAESYYRSKRAQDEGSVSLLGDQCRVETALVGLPFSGFFPALQSLPRSPAYRGRFGSLSSGESSRDGRLFRVETFRFRCRAGFPRLYGSRASGGSCPTARSAWSDLFPCFPRTLPTTAAFVREPVV